MSDAPLTSEQLKAARELLGWSQMDVANRVGLSEWVIGFYERGERLSNNPPAKPGALRM